MDRQFNADHNTSLLITHLADNKIISNPRLVESKNSYVGKRKATVAIEAEAQIEGQHVKLQIGLDAWFPQSLPFISLVPWNALGFIPHVEADGNICYAQRDGLLLNRRDLEGIVDEALLRAVSVLTRGYRGENKWDFVDEFEAYWANINGVKKILSVIAPKNHLRKIIAGKNENASNDENAYIYVSDTVACIRSFYNSNDLQQYTHRNALYIPFKLGTFIMPPAPDIPVGIEFFQDIVSKHLTKDEFRTLKKLARKPKREEMVIFQIPRPSGGEVLFGVLFEGVTNVHPVLPKGTAQKITPLVVQRRDKTYLLPRGGANEALQEKRVVLFGCGSIGGYIALNLVHSGVLEMILIDDDILTAENTFRHVLGKNMWGQAKTDGLRDEIQQKFPYARPLSFQMTAQKTLEAGVVDLDNCDLVIVAIGDDTISLFLNEKLRYQKFTPPILYTWLEPYGIGGHVLVTGNSVNKGCFECLFTPVSMDENYIINNRASFTTPNQSFSKDLSGCANPFTPYGSQSVEQTAALASRIAVQVMLGKVKGNPLFSWKGDATEFLRAGFILSPRYNLPEEELANLQYEYQNDRCPICGLAGE